MGWFDARRTQKRTVSIRLHPGKVEGNEMSEQGRRRAPSVWIVQI